MRKIGSILTLLGLLPVLAYAGLTAAFRADLIGFGDVFGQLSWLAPALGAGGVAALVGAVLLWVKRAAFPGLVGVLIGLAGLAMFASLAAGVHADIHAAQEAMGQGWRATYTPDPQRAAMLAARYEDYQAFGAFEQGRVG